MESVENVLRNSLRHKFQAYNPEPSKMPFHTRLLGKDRMALFSFIQSLNTNFGTTIFEPAAKALAEKHFASAELQQCAGFNISSDADNVINSIMRELTIGNKSLPDKNVEVEKIRRVCRNGEKIQVKPTKVDLKLKAKDGALYLIDLKSAKPNSGEFKGLKRTLLEWVAAVLYNDPKAEVHTLIAIPYNPYEPEPYKRWTMRGMLDTEEELKVAEEFWDFVGGNGAYGELLNTFEKVGIEMRQEIDDYFAKFTKSNL